MGLFNLFKKNNKLNGPTTDNGVVGPSYLDGLTDHIPNPKGLHSHEWRRKLITSSGHTKFKIRYYGQLHDKHPNLIVRTDFAPSLVIAIDSLSNQEIVLFDGCKHGYNALFCDTFTNDQIQHRPVTNLYTDKDGNDTFELVISTYCGIDYDDEFGDQVDENGLLELIDGTKLAMDIVKRNGYDTLQIWATREDGETIEMVSEELA